MNTILAHVCVLLAFAASASAEIIGVEQFDYPDGGIAAKNGGTFWDYKNFTPVGHTGTASNWDNVFGAPVVSSGRLATNNSGAKREYHGAPESDGAVNDPASAPSSVAKAVYYRVTVTTGATVPDFFGLSSYDFGGETIFFGKRFGQPHFGLAFGGTASDSTVTVQPNTTYTLVTRLDYAANTVRLYVNPVLNAPEPVTAAASATYNDTFWSTAVRLASGAGDPIIWDNLVVATTWDDLGTVVTTAVDEDEGSLDPGARAEPAAPNSAPGTGVSLREAVKYSPNGTLITFDPALSGRTVTLTNGQLVAPTGGKLHIDASNLPLGLTIDGNNTSRLFSVGFDGVLTLKSLTLTRGNAGVETGGAISTEGTLRLHDCTLSGNRAQSGGAIASLTSAGLVTEVLRCTLSGNVATADEGGAIRNNIGTTVIAFSTISGNSAPLEQGGGIASYGDSFTSTIVSSSIVSANSGGDVAFSPGAQNSFVSLGYNLVGVGNATGNFTSTGDQTGMTDPQLAPLGYFGGPTMTMHPLIGSPAIDTGVPANPGGRDQRGFSRFRDGNDDAMARADIGAVEAGETYLVSSATDGGLRAVLNIAYSGVKPGGRIIFDPVTFATANPPAITLNGNELVVPAGESIFIDASNMPAGVTISGNDASRVFAIRAGASVAMQLLAITNGKAPDGDGIAGPGESGGGILNNGQLSLISSSITNCHAGNGGLDFDPTGPNGPAAAVPSGAGGNGGGISSSGPLSLIFPVIIANRAGDGSNGEDAGDRGGDGGSGGGVCSSGPLSLQFGFISTNEAGAGGDVLESGNSAGGDGGKGGGIFTSGHSEVVSSQIRDNRTGFGGSVFGSGGQDNSPGSGGDGGGIFSSGTLRVASSLLSANQTGFGGQAPFGGSGSVLGSGGRGAGVFSAGSFELLSSTLVGNQATAFSGGGGLHADLGARGLVMHATIVGNNGGGFRNDAGNPASTLTLRYSIVAQNNGFSGDAGGAFINDTNLIGGDPLLAPLGDYGGPTLTMALKPGSPARDAATGSTITADQRGFAAVGVPDIGAYEAGTLHVNFNAYIWETLPATATEEEHDADHDYDGDGQSNFNEWLAGTDVTSAASVFRMSNMTRNGSTLTLTFTSVAGHSYRLQFSTDLVGWTDFGNPIDGTGNPIAAQVTVNMATFPKFFLRVRLLP